MFIRASDGTKLYVRHVCPNDKEIIGNAWLRLSDESRRRRFLSRKPQLSSAELRYLTEIDGHDHVALIAVLLDDPSHAVAVARYVRMRSNPEVAEIAVTVADDMQGKRIGTMLGVLLADEARGRGLRRFSGSMLAENSPALRLMDTMGARLRSDVEYGVRDLVTDIAA
jgi:RimJ/RimL family protein N-acetyltransferase